MATTTYKILGQQAPSATTETDLYTVPSSTEAIISSLVICNRAATSATYRVYVAANGAAAANNQYLVYDSTINGNDTVALSLGITLDAADKVRVYASSANLSFNAFGTEIA